MKGDQGFIPPGIVVYFLCLIRFFSLRLRLSKVHCGKILIILWARGSNTVERRPAYLHVKKTICPIWTSAPIPKIAAVPLKNWSADGGPYPYLPKRWGKNTEYFHEVIMTFVDTMPNVCN